MLKLIDDNFNLHSLKIPGLTEGMKVIRLTSLTYVDSGLSCDTFNIIHITNGNLLTEKEFSQAVNHFRNKQFAFCIWVGHENLSSRVEAILKNGSVKQQNAEPGMILDLATYEPMPDAPLNHIKIAYTKQDVKDFADVVAANWTPPDENVRKYFEMTADHYLNPANRVLLAVYYHEDRPVSVIELFGSGEKDVGFYGLATLAAFRGKGIGSALMKFALNRAKEDGYQYAILQASEDGIRIYEKYGFRTKTQYFEFA